jgi:hypothetical protein
MEPNKYQREEPIAITWEFVDTPDVDDLLEQAYSIILGDEFNVRLKSEEEKQLKA